MDTKEHIQERSLLHASNVAKAFVWQRIFNGMKIYITQKSYQKLSRVITVLVSLISCAKSRRKYRNKT